MLNIEWEEVKYRILKQFVLDFPFVKIIGLLNFDINKYINSHQLITEFDKLDIEKGLNFVFKKIFKMIGMRVDVNMFLQHQLKEINEIKRLLFIPTMTFDLDAGLDFSIQNNDLHNLKREQLLKRLEGLSPYFVERNTVSDVPIDIVFGDEDYLRDKLFKLRISDVVQKKINYLSSRIDWVYIQQMSEKMKLRYEECIQQEVSKYLSELLGGQNRVK